ncbi:MAG TPA: hypothetical protein PLW34_11915 [Termitinemataceae bacterium]|nr:hypothetical protein [Termitinemataceae bacterium]HOM24478.1 hypothetical protein [Termitinemataceae bacterium]HPQ01565.1 hypothetical protein [Termitinemataceae bacterium]
MNVGITCQHQGKDGFFTVCWSKLQKADRHTIVRSVPAVGGIYEIYWMDDHNHLRLLTVGNARYGGLRSEIRRLTDPSLVENPEVVQILNEKTIWFRYAPCDSIADMADVVWFFRKTYFPENPGVSHSGRFTRIFIKEWAPDQVRWVD